MSKEKWIPAVGDRVRADLVLAYQFKAETVEGVISEVGGKVIRIRDTVGHHVIVQTRACRRLVKKEKPKRLERYFIVDKQDRLYSYATKEEAAGQAKKWNENYPSIGPHRVVLMREVVSPWPSPNS